jgi:hypothetical protein
MSTIRIGGHCVEMGGSDGPWHRMATANLENRPEAGLDRPDTWNFPLISFEDLAAERFDKTRSFTTFSEQLWRTAGGAGRSPPRVGCGGDRPASPERQECQSPNISTKFLPVTLAPR